MQISDDDDDSHDDDLEDEDEDEDEDEHDDGDRAFSVEHATPLPTNSFTALIASTRDAHATLGLLQQNCPKDSASPPPVVPLVLVPVAV